MALGIRAIMALFCACICIWNVLGLHRAEGLLSSLSKDYYKQTCPNAENVIRDTIRNATRFDPKIPARILRMHFHDCFIRGCDGSVLLDSTANNTAEKDAAPNVSLRGFYVIDDAKSKLESVCPQTVSCADILAIAARDVVVLAGGPQWEVVKGRKDGVISRANETRGLPATTFNVSQLLQTFILRGLSLNDMVALSGGHTLGFSHCSSFASRLHSFNGTHDKVDPAMQPQFAQSLLALCPKSNTNLSAGAFLDSTANRFDNAYYKHLVQGKGVFGSDQALFTEKKTKTMVKRFAKDEKAFFAAFASSMLKMGSVGVQTNMAEVRLNCRKVNS